MYDNYKFYRKRFLANFISIGPEQGQSLPINQLYAMSTPSARWGDITIDMGWYLSILSSEYAINNYLQLDSAKEAVISELYYALNALKRLDSLGNTIYGLPAKVDGFFIRDDVPEDFFTNGPGIDFDFELLGIKNIDSVTPVTTVLSDYQLWQVGKPRRNIGPKSINPVGMMVEMSKDQVTGVFTGLKFVTEYIPDKQMEIKLLDGTTITKNLHRMASKLGALIFLWVERDFPENPNKASFKIYTPDGQEATPGGDVFFFQEPFLHLGVEFLNEHPYLLDTLSFNPIRKRKAGHLFWNITQKQPLDNHVNWTMIAKLAATTSTWTGIRVKSFPNKTDVTQEVLEKKLIKNDWHTLYCLMHAVLQNTTVSKDVLNSSIRQLNEINPSGSHDHGVTERTINISKKWGLDTCQTEPYAYQNRFKKLKDVQYDISKYRYREAGFYSGMDFMLLHNLFVLYKLQN
jgi:hypothetical protein